MYHDELDGRGIYSHNDIDRTMKPPTFTTPSPFLNSWVSHSATYPPRYTKDGHGWVTLHGAVKDGAIGTVAFTLPVGYRPAYADIWAVDSYAAYGRVLVSTNGDVAPLTGDNRSVFLTGIRFYAG